MARYLNFENIFNGYYCLNQSLTSLNYHNRGWRALCKRVGVVGLRWHDLRREVTSRMFERGFSLTEVQSVTGHRTLQMLSTYTTH